MVKRGKATPSTSSGGSSNKGNEVKAKNYYDRMHREHTEIKKKPISLAEQRNKHKQEKTKISPEKRQPPQDILDFNPAQSPAPSPGGDMGPLFDVDESAIVMHAESDRSFEMEARQVVPQSPAQQDTSLGLTHMKDQSKLDMTDFMMGGNTTPYIYIVSGYKE